MSDTIQGRAIVVIGVALASLSLSSIVEAQHVIAPEPAAEIEGTPPGTLMPKSYVEMVGRWPISGAGRWSTI